MRQATAVIAAIGVLFAGAASLVPAQASSTGSAAVTVSDPVIAAVGDIACKNPPGNNRKVCQYDDVAALIKRGDYDRFLALGDIQYEAGSLQDFRDNYDVYFGDLMSITEPVPGNHEYGTEGARGYYRYFGDRGHGPDGYYSYDLGAWHVIALNSAICPAGVGCGPGDPQYEWLQQDLAANEASAHWRTGTTPAMTGSSTRRPTGPTSSSTSRPRRSGTCCTTRMRTWC